MVRFAAVPLPACEPEFRSAAVTDEIGRWVRAEPMRALVAEYGGTLPDGGVDEVLGWLAAFSEEHWDFRRHGNVERDQVVAPDFTGERAGLVRAAAEALHLADAARPPHAAYDHLLVLGGLGRSCLQRTEYAAHLARHVVAVPEVTALGSFRALNAAETALPSLGKAGHEVDAMDAGVRAAFGFGEPVRREGSDGDVTHGSWAVRTYRADGRPEVHVLAAPSSAPAERRANTPDTYEFWARRADLRATDRILIVTSPIYVPFQHCDAIRMLALRHRCGIDTVGFDPALVTVPPAPGAAGPDRYLQEIRSAVLSMRALRSAL